jgi:6-phosphogluconolactonase
MARNGDVTVLPDAAALAQAAAERVVIVLARALSRAGNAHIALAGGSTPRAVNALLTADPLRGAVDWRRVVFWFGDERCVPPDDDESN